MDAWSSVVAPGGNEYDPVLGPRRFTIDADSALLGNLAQPVPAHAPPGEYSYIGNLGKYPFTVLAADSFSVMVVPPAAGTLVGCN